MLSDAEAPVQGRSTKTVRTATNPGDLKKLGKYQIERRLGAGGMGTVYLARDTTMRRAVALKVLSKDKAENPILVRRFQAEAQAAAQLTHDNIVSVYDSGAADGYLYIAMEYIDGIDLHELVNKRGAIPVKRSIEIIKQVAAALEHASQKQIVHRDIKPSNLLIRRDGVVKLTDLGLARSVDDTIETGITRAGTTVGTVDYMAPEQAKSSKAADIRSDIYSLGCTWYHMLTGGPPYPEGSLTNKLQAHATKPLPDPRAVNDQVTDALVAVMHRMMAKKPEDRYQTPGDLLKDLENSTLTKAAFSQEIFDAIEEESATDVPTRPEKATAAGAMPPMTRRRGSSDDEKQGGINFEVVKLGMTVVLIGGVATFLGWLVYSFGGLLEGPTRAASKPADALGGQGAPNQVAVAPVGGVAAGTGSTLITGTEVAPVYGSGTMIQPGGTTSGANFGQGNAGPEINTPTTASAFIPGAPGSTNVGGTGQPGAGSNVSPAAPYDPLQVPDWVTAVATPAATGAAGVGTTGTGVGATGIGSTGTGTSGVGTPGTGMPGTSKSGTGTPGTGRTGTGTTGTGATGSGTTGTGSTTSRAASTGVGATQSGAGTTLAPGGKSASGTPGVINIPGVRNVTVGAAASSNTGASNTATPTTQAHTLGEALAQVGAEGAAIQLVGNGPFVINAPVSLTARRLVIFAAIDSEPLIVFAPGAQNSFGGLTLSGGTLELRGIHVAADVSVKQAATLLTVRDGSAILSGCSFTVGGADASGLAILGVEGVVPKSSRVLVDRTVIRGDVRTALDLRTSTVEAVVRESLVVAGNGSAVRFAADSRLIQSVPGQPSRSVKCVHSTLASRGHVFDLTADADRNETPATHLSLINSVCCTAGSDGPRVLLDATGWKQDAVRDAIAWTAHESVFLGFHSLVDFGAPPAVHVKDAEAWRVFWRQRAEPDQFRDELWPRQIDKVAGATLGDFDAHALPDAAKKVSSSGDPPGVLAARLKVHEAVAPERLSALAHRRMLPPALLEPAGDKFTSRVDLRKEDLGQVLNRGDWPDGAAIEAVGYGVCYITPVQINKRTLRIVFHQSADGPGPLRLMPKDSSKEAEGLFRIDQGTLVLEGLRWQGPDPKPSVPQWLVSARDASVVFRNCELLGPERAATPFQGIVKFSTENSAATTPPALVVIDSFLHSSGTLVRADVAAGSVFVRNSLLVARGTAFDVRPRVVGDDLPLVLDLVQSTLSATQSVFQWTAASLTKPPRIPAQVFVDRCVFGPPFALKGSDVSQPTLLTWSGPVMEQHQIDWWGLSNGVAGEVKHMLRPEGGLPASDKTGVQAWEAAWGAGHEVRLLARPGGVILADDQLPTRRDALRPRSYQLHPNSKAIVWADGRPIGADLASLDDVGPEKIGAAATTKNAPNTKKTANPPVQTPIKNNGGF